MTVRKCNLPLKKQNMDLLKIRVYLCHVCKVEVGGSIFLVFLDNFKKFFLPLHCHFKLSVVSSIVVQGEGQEESFRVSEVLICLKKKKNVEMRLFWGSSNSHLRWESQSLTLVSSYSQEREDWGSIIGHAAHT